MTEIIAIARNTFKEAIRNRILYVILIFALLLIGFAGVLSELTIASRMRIILHMGFTCINLFGVAIAIFVGVSLVYNELEKKTIYTIVSKPIGRWQFLLGKYFGLLMTVWVNVLIMSLFFLISVHYHAMTGSDHGFVATLLLSIGKGIVSFFWWGAFGVSQQVMPVILVTLLELAIVTSFAVLFSSFSTPTLSMFFSVLTFVAGRMNEDIVRFADQILRNARQALPAGVELTSKPISFYVADGIAHVVPNLGVFNDTVAQVVYEEGIDLAWGSIAYGLLYTAGVLALSILIFQQRNFK